jgi:sigma-B regulation protein RsbU (phosphoserine phosphatase)
MMTRILIVDDEPDQRLRIKFVLTKQGYEIVEAGDGVEALAVLQREAVPIVITDWSMPNLDGLELCRAIRAGAASSKVYIIFLTSQGDKARLVEAIDAGADDYLTKPAHPAELAVRIRNGERTLKAREELEAVNARLRQDLEAAARIQRALLPSSLPDCDRVHFAWAYHPSATLAGDHLNMFWLDDRHIGLYLLDVSGHGVSASLLAVTASRFLSPTADVSSSASRPRTANPPGSPGPARSWTASTASSRTSRPNSSSRSSTASSIWTHWECLTRSPATPARSSPPRTPHPAFSR